MNPQPSRAHSSLRCPVTLFAAAVAQAARRVEALAQDLHTRRDTFGDCLAEAVALNSAQTGLQRMDVGGTPFHTHAEVLQRHGGMLSVMASEDFPGGSDEGGCSFVDRDPRWFPLVLQFLRTGVASLPDKDEERAAVFREAQYYSLEGPFRSAQLQPEAVIVGLSLDNYLQRHIYDPQWQSWESKTLDDPRVGTDVYYDNPTFVAGNECVFMFNDADDPHSLVCRVYQYRPSTDRWDAIATFPHADDFDNALDCCTAFGNGCLYIIEEEHQYIPATSRVKSFNLATGQWQTLPPLLTARHDASACVVDGRLFVTGRSGTANEAFPSPEEYIPAEQRWEYIPAMPTPLDGATAVEWEGKLLILGGRGAHSLSRAVLEYDPVQHSWRQLPSMIQPRARC